MSDNGDFDNRFNYHRPDATTQEAHQFVRNAARAAAEEFDRLLVESREKSLALTKLEEAMFWANAALARHYSDGGRR